MNAEMPATVRKRLIVSGQVQDVGYMALVKRIARRLGIFGFIRNLPDGTVEVVCEGAIQAMQQFQKRIDRKGDPESALDIDVASIAEMPAPEGSLGIFDIDYSQELTQVERSSMDREEKMVLGASLITQEVRMVGEAVKVV
jgi:acylphosphatase